MKLKVLHEKILVDPMAVQGWNNSLINRALSPCFMQPYRHDPRPDRVPGPRTAKRGKELKYATQLQNVHEDRKMKMGIGKYQY